MVTPLFHSGFFFFPWKWTSESLRYQGNCSQYEQIISSPLLGSLNLFVCDCVVTCKKLVSFSKFHKIVGSEQTTLLIVCENESRFLNTFFSLFGVEGLIRLCNVTWGRWCLCCKGFVVAVLLLKVIKSSYAGITLITKGCELFERWTCRLLFM